MTLGSRHWAAALGAYRRVPGCPSSHSVLPCTTLYYPQAPAHSLHKTRNIPPPLPNVSDLATRPSNLGQIARLSRAKIHLITLVRPSSHHHFYTITRPRYRVWAWPCFSSCRADCCSYLADAQTGFMLTSLFAPLRYLSTALKLQVPVHVTTERGRPDDQLEMRSCTIGETLILFAYQGAHGGPCAHLNRVELTTLSAVRH